MITHIRSSSVLKSNRKTHRTDHSAEFMRMTCLNPYDGDKIAPTLFYGMYNRADYLSFRFHKGPRVVYWGGSDVTKAVKNKIQLKGLSLHVVQTPANATALKRIGISAIVRPLVFADPKFFNLEPMGSCVYSYVGWFRSEMYGIKTIKTIAKEFPDINFLLTRCINRKPFPNGIGLKLGNKRQIRQIYAKCFCGIRPIAHDGFSQSVGEMALMGRRTGWIYHYPCSEKCITADDYVKFIERESKRKHPDKRSREFILSLNNLDFLRYPEG